MLIVEDDRGIAAFLDKGLSAEGHALTIASTAEEARWWMSANGTDADLILLDLMLPDGTGETLLRWIRTQEFDVPVIILTAKTEVSAKVAGLDAGANDYITKPFAFDELLARIRAVLRNTSQVSATELVVADLRLDLLTKVAQRAGRRVDLAPREWAILELLASSSGECNDGRIVAVLS